MTETEKSVCTIARIWQKCFHDDDGKPICGLDKLSRIHVPVMAKDGILFKEPRGRHNALQWCCFPSRVMRWRENGGMLKK